MQDDLSSGRGMFFWHRPVNDRFVHEDAYLLSSTESYWLWEHDGDVFLAVKTTHGCRMLIESGIGPFFLYSPRAIALHTRGGCYCMIY
jgi:hypothetical protein